MEIIIYNEKQETELTSVRKEMGGYLKELEL